MKTNWEHSELHVGCKKKCCPVTIGSHWYLFGFQTVCYIAQAVQCNVVFQVENCVHQFLHLVLRSFLNYQTFLCITYHVSSELFTLWNAYTSYELSSFLSRTQICEHFKDPTINTLKSKAKFICQTVGVRNLWEQVLGKETFEVKQCLPHQQCNH